MRLPSFGGSFFLFLPILYHVCERAEQCEQAAVNDNNSVERRAMQNIARLSVTLCYHYTTNPTICQVLFTNLCDYFSLTTKKSHRIRNKLLRSPRLNVQSALTGSYLCTPDVVTSFTPTNRFLTRGTFSQESPPCRTRKRLPCCVDVIQSAARNSSGLRPRYHFLRTAPSRRVDCAV